MICQSDDSNGKFLLDLEGNDIDYPRNIKEGPILMASTIEEKGFSPCIFRTYARSMRAIQTTRVKETQDIMEYVERSKGGILFIDPSTSRVFKLSDAEPCFIFPGEDYAEYMANCTPRERAKRILYYEIIKNIVEESKIPHLTAIECNYAVNLYSNGGIKFPNIMSGESLMFYFEMWLNERRFNNGVSIQE